MIGPVVAGCAHPYCLRGGICADCAPIYRFRYCSLLQFRPWQLAAYRQAKDFESKTEPT